ncbi:MAG: dihydroneopterin aldolase family protein [Thermoplasmata archaeon]
MEDPADAYFGCSDSERAAFEAGIKLGSIYHQFMGTPLSQQNVDVLERAIEEGVKVQPFVEDVRVRIDRRYLKRKRSPYKYVSLTGNMLQVELRVRYGDAVALCEMRFVEDLRYPLMYVKEIRWVGAETASRHV